MVGRTGSPLAGPQGPPSRLGSRARPGGAGARNDLWSSLYGAAPNSGKLRETVERCARVVPEARLWRDGRGGRGPGWSPGPKGRSGVLCDGSGRCLRSNQLSRITSLASAMRARFGPKPLCRGAAMRPVAVHTLPAWLAARSDGSLPPAPASLCQPQRFDGPSRGCLSSSNWVFPIYG